MPEILNLVFFKAVRSKTKFWQMLGRGTRLAENLFGPGRHKTSFTVFDFCQNFEFFNQNPDLTDGASGTSLGASLFSARVGLITKLDELEEQEATDAASTPLLDLRRGLAGRLIEEVSGMTPDNFLVRPKRRLVEKYSAAEAWTRLGLEDVHELTSEVAGLPSSYVDDDIAAKQFDLLVLRAQLALLNGDAGFGGLKDKIVQIASLLEERANVPMVAEQIVLIEEVQTDAYWQDITAPILETLRRKLRALVKLIELKHRPVVFTDFEDEIGEGVEVVVTGVAVGTDMASFRRKARHFLRDNENHIAVLKLRRNEPLTATDLSELERIFLEAGIADAEDLERLKPEGGLGLFVRSLIGLDREAAKAAFTGFLQHGTRTANQIEFVDMLIDHLTEKGQVEPSLLYESPFTDFDPMGVAGVFGTADAAEVISILDEVRGRAAA